MCKGTGVGCETGPNSGDFAHIVQSRPCIAGALGMAALSLIL